MSPGEVGPEDAMATSVGDAAPAPAAPQFTGAPFTDLVEMVRSGFCILFLGAGVHYPPPADSGYDYPEELRPPLGATLAKRLAPKCDFEQICAGESAENLQRVAHCFERQLGRQRLAEEIKAAVGGSARPSAAVRGLAELPFKLVMTTNYDRLFERALRRDAVDREPIVLVYDPRGEEPTGDFPGDLTEIDVRTPWLLKMHGDLESPDSIVVTDEDYINFVRRMTAMGDNYPIPASLLYALRKRPVLFVGYGLLDFNLRLLFHTLRWRLDPANSPRSYSVDLKPDPLVRTVWTEQLGLNFIVEDVWSFVPRLYEAILGREMPA
jgi:hypothetical protein